MPACVSLGSSCLSLSYIPVPWIPVSFIRSLSFQSHNFIKCVLYIIVSLFSSWDPYNVDVSKSVFLFAFLTG